MKSKIKVDIDLLDKAKWYCLSCLKEGIITEFDTKNKKFNCKHSGYSYRYQYCLEGNHWSGRMGTSEKSICASCNIGKNANAPEVCKRRLNTIKQNGNYDKCINNLILGHSEKSRKSASETMKLSGGYDKCIKAMNTKEAKQKEVITKRKLGVYDKIRHITFCNKCNKNTLHMYNVCLICHPESDTSGHPSLKWLEMSIEEKIIEEEKWLEDNRQSNQYSYHKNNLALLKLKQSGQYDNTFKDIEEDLDLDNPNIGWIYGHIDTRNNELYYVGQTLRNPIKRYAEHYDKRINDLYKEFHGYGSQEEYIRITGITQERIDNTKVVIIHKVYKPEDISNEKFKNMLLDIEADTIKILCPKMNFYMIEE